MSTGVDPALASPHPVEILRRVDVSSQLISNYAPLWRSLEWQLSELYWKTAGLQVFSDGEVPFAVNNSGNLAARAAALLLANCRETQPEGEIAVLELGAGCGLFARAFVNAFRAACAAAGEGFYDRLVYYVSDSSPRTVAQWAERGQFDGFSGHVVIGLCDALHPQRFEAAVGGTVELKEVRAVIANYVLDSLPASVVRRGPQGVEEVNVRSHLTGDAQRLRAHPEANLEDIRGWVRSDDLSERQRLIPLLTLFEWEAEFQPCVYQYRGLGEALAFAKGMDRCVLNHGALTCLEGCLEIVGRGGFVLSNDYGHIERANLSSAAVATERFGRTAAMALNYPFLAYYFGGDGKPLWVRPSHDGALAIHPRLLMRTDLPRTLGSFDMLFGEDLAAFEEQVKAARQHAGAGRIERAKQGYEQVLAHAGHDWQLLGEVAEFLLRHTRDYQAAVQLAETAIQRNPWYGAWHWNVLGDAYFCGERYNEAHTAFLRARELSPTDVRASFNLAFTHTQFGEYEAALKALGAALANDVSGEYRQRLLSKQQEILTILNGQGAAEREWAERRVARLNVR